MSIESVVGALEVLSQNAIKGEMAGTGLSMILTKLQTELGYDLSKKGLPEILKELAPRMKDVTWLSDKFNAEQLKTIQVLLSNADAVGEMTKKSNRHKHSL